MSRRAAVECSETVSPLRKITLTSASSKAFIECKNPSSSIVNIFGYLEVGTKRRLRSYKVW